MKTTTILTLTLVTLLLTSCNKYKYWDISKFKIENNALEDGEEVKAFYASNGPINEEHEYYYHLIVISQKTGDTVNVLTTYDNCLEPEDGDKIFKFIAGDYDLVNIKTTDGVNIELTDINKVARDPQFDAIADNKYPTIIGTLGMVTQNKE